MKMRNGGAFIKTMKIEILKVELHEYEEITTSEKYMNEYRRHEQDFWEHKLGVHGWNRIIDPSIYEDAYVDWRRKSRKQPAINK
jgi:hypothetical protein